MYKEDKEAIRKELQDMGSTLGDRDKSSGFQVPHGFFGGFHSSVQERISRHKRKGYVIWGVPEVYYKKLVPVLAAVVLVVAIGIGFILQRGDLFIDQYAADDYMLEWEYMATHSEHDQMFLYYVVFESDISADEIYYGLETIPWNGEALSEELMEAMFEQAQYYGIDSSYLLSSLD